MIIKKFITGNGRFILMMALFPILVSSSFGQLSAYDGFDSLKISKIWNTSKMVDTRLVIAQWKQYCE